MNNKIERVGRVRAWLKRDDERREREAAAPRAICKVCGGWAKAGEGSREEAPVKMRPHPTRDGVMITSEPAPANADDWRRECRSCVASSMADVVRQVIGHELSDADARVVVSRMKTIDPEHLTLHLGFPTAQATGGGTGRAWGHLRAEDRERVRRVLRDVTRERQIGPCVQGACGLCGRRNSLRWFEGYAFLRWPDGSPAPVCRECQGVADRRPAPQNIDALRVIAVECATGHAQWGYTAPREFRVYAESKDCDGNGHPEPWTYSPGITVFREDMWESRPSLAPADRQDEFSGRLRARIEDTTRRAQEEREAEHAAAW